MLPVGDRCGVWYHRPGRPEIRAPLASAVTTPTGSWAVVAMGQLDHPLDTFWELFYRATSTSLWHLVTPTGVADNGGLVVSVAGVGAATVGFRTQPVTPLLAIGAEQRRRRDLGRRPLSRNRWSATPDALSATTGNAGTALALVREGAAAVLTAKGPLLAGTHCPAIPPAGQRIRRRVWRHRAGCRRPHFVEHPPCRNWLSPARDRWVSSPTSGSYWKLIGPSLHGSLSGTTTRILRLDSSGETTTALLAEEGRGGIGLLGLWGSATGTWSESHRLPLGGAPALRASALGSSGQQLVFVEERGKPAMLEEAVGASQPWRRLPSPPTGTETVSMLADGSINAFSVDGSKLRIFTLALDGASWSLSQTLNVPIAYGSS